MISAYDVPNMEFEAVVHSYDRFVNPCLASVLGSFGFGRELVDHAAGPYIYLKNGRVIKDFTGGIGVLNHGHNHPEILQVRRWFNENRFMEVHKNYLSQWTAALSSNIAGLFPDPLNYCYFPNSGAEAVEGCIKACYASFAGKRNIVLHADISFHGKLLGAASITGSVEIDSRFPEITGVDRFKFNDAESLIAAIDRHTYGGKCDVYAIVIEPFSASSVRECSDEFLVFAREISNRFGIKLIFDEVYTGWGKTGHLFNFMRVGDLVPDACSFAKSLGGGKASISGYIVSDELMANSYANIDDVSLHSTTYYGFGEEMATAIEAAKIVVRDDYPKLATSIGSVLGSGLSNLKDRFPALIQDVRGAGCLWGIEFRKSYLVSVLDVITSIAPEKITGRGAKGLKLVVGSVISRLYDEHDYLTYFGSNVGLPLKVAPSIITSPDECQLFIKSFAQILEKGNPSNVGEFVRKKIERR